MVQRIKTVQESDLRMLGSLARSIQRVLPVTQADIDAAAALGQGWVVTRVVEVSDPLDNLRGGTQLVIRQNSILPGQNVQRVLIVSGPGGETVIVRGSEYIALPDAIANSLEYIKAFGGTEQRNLPAEYTQVEYLESDGNQYIDTGVKGNGNTKVEIKWKYSAESTAIGSGRVFGSQTSPVSNSFVIGTLSGTASSSAEYLLTYDSQNYFAPGVSVGIGVWVTIIHSRTIHIINGTSYTKEYDSTTFETPQNLKIFAFDNNGTLGVGRGMCAYTKIWDGDILVRNFVPCRRNSDSVLGMYDTVSGTFFTNAGTGTFTAGGEAVPTPDTPMDIVSNNGVLKLSPNLFNQSLFNTDCSSTISYVSYSIPNGTYTMSTDFPEAANVTNVFIFAGKVTSGASSSINGVTSVTPRTITVTDGKYTVAYRSTHVTNTNNPKDFNWQLEAGLTPTAYIPYGTIYTDGTVETINVHGKNLFDINNVTIQADTSIGSDGSLIPNVATKVCMTYLPVKPNTTYTISGDILGSATAFFRLAQYKSDKTFLGRSADSTGQRSSYTFTTGADTYFVRFHCITEANLNTYQLELGSTATTYQPYFDGGTATAEMLLKVGDYEDVQSIIDGVVTRKVGVKVLDGTENWQNLSGYMNIIKTDLGTNSTVLPANSTDIFCTHFQVKTDTFVDGVGSGGSYINFKYDSAFTTLAQFKQFLADQYNAGTPVIIVYPLATPTTESVAGQTLQVQQGDNFVEITQAAIDNLELEAKYQAAVSLTIQEVQDANLDPNVQVTIN